MRLAVLLAVPAALLLSACAALPPPPAVAPPVASGSTEPLRFKTLSTGLMRRGMETGRYVIGFDCAGPYGRMLWGSGQSFRTYNTFRERFNGALLDAGFDVAGQAWEDGGGRRRARYSITGELREVQQALCRHRSWLVAGDRGVTGVGRVRIDWTVYDPAGERVVYQTSTTGRAELERGVPDGEVLLLEEGFSRAAEALAAEPGFRAAVARGGPPPVLPPPEPAALPLIAAVPPVVEAPAAADGDGAVRVGGGQGVLAGVADGQSLVLAPYRTAGTAGDAADGTVPVRAGGVWVEGRVTARDAATGLMLVRLPAPLPAPPLRADPPEVSEPVRTGGFAQGIVAGLSGGILADLEGPAPEPGEPLFDGAGRLLGLALPARREAGLARFVPVAAALAALGVSPQHANLDGRGRPPT